MLVFETRLPAPAWFWSGVGLDREAVLAAFDEQIRRHRGPDVLSGPAEHDVIRSAPVMGGWTGVTWSDLDHLSADVVIAEQINRFAGLARPWEWKHYSYDLRQADAAQAGWMSSMIVPSGSCI
jgi:hypothetical protein